MVHNLLWTGGFDSTFRLCQLSREDCVIQPIYLKIKERLAVKYELEAQQKILRFLDEKGHKATILPVKVVDMSPYMNDIDTHSAFERMCADDRIGGQYVPMASFVNHFGYCELCQEGYVNSPGALTRMLMNGVVFKYDEMGNRFIDKSKSDKDKVIIFGNYYFPILDINNLQMIDMLKKWGLYGVISLVRFCMSDTEESCGYCVCCLNKASISKEVFKFSKEALRQIEICMYLRKIDKTKEFYYSYCLYMRNKEICYLTDVIKNNINHIPLGFLYHKFDKLNSLSTKMIRKLYNRYGSIDDFINKF